jgi:hypothetical protein
VLPESSDTKSVMTALVGKNISICPTILLSKEARELGVKVSQVEQRAGELALTFPVAYHWGFNAGDFYPCNESV